MQFLKMKRSIGNLISTEEQQKISNQIIRKLMMQDASGMFAKAKTCYTQIEANGKHQGASTCNGAAMRRAELRLPNGSNPQPVSKGLSLNTDRYCKTDDKPVLQGSNTRRAMAESSQASLASSPTAHASKKWQHVSKSTEFTANEIKNLRQKKINYASQVYQSSNFHSTTAQNTKRNSSAQSTVKKENQNSLHEHCGTLKKSQIFYRKINSNISSQYMSKNAASTSKTNDTLSKEKSSSISQSLIYKQISSFQPSLSIKQFKQKFKSMQSNQDYLSPKQDSSKLTVSCSSRSAQNTQRNFKSAENPYQFEINNILKRNIKPQKSNGNSSH